MTSLKKKKDYPQQANADELFENAARLMGSFQRKTLSKGSIVPVAQVDPVLAHRCAALRGTSGGAFLAFVNGSLRLLGIHLGGIASIESNVALLATAEQFMLEYFSHVCKEDFFERHCQDRELAEAYAKCRREYPSAFA